MLELRTFGVEGLDVPDCGGDVSGRLGMVERERQGGRKGGRKEWRKGPKLTHIRILLNTPITTKKSHPRHTRNTFLQPSRLILIRLIHQLMRLNITIEIIRHEVIIPVVGNGVA